MGANVLVRGAVAGTGEPVPLFQGLWRGVPDGHAVFQLQRTAEPDDGVRLMLDRLVEAGLGAYLDARVRFGKQGVVTDLPPARMMHEMDAMVNAAADELGMPGTFDGFSAATRAQLDRLVRIDWGQARFAVDGDGGQDKYLAVYRFVRAQREELERQIRADLLPLATVPVIGPKAGTPGTTVRINSTCGTVFDEENFLCALDLRLADTGSGGVDPGWGDRALLSLGAPPTPAAPAPAADVRVRKRDRWLKTELDRINERIDRTDQRKELWELRDRMDDIEDRITGLEMDVRGDVGRPGDNPMANLSVLTGRNITLRFARNTVALDPGYRVLLNEVFEQLARSPKERVLITGYTDRSGDAAVNLRLSEQRAKAVRDYLLQRGIAAERLMVNYYGDSRSMGRNPDERRVEIEWLR